MVSRVNEKWHLQNGGIRRFATSFQQQQTGQISQKQPLQFSKKQKQKQVVKRFFLRKITESYVRRVEDYGVLHPTSLLPDTLILFHQR